MLEEPIHRLNLASEATEHEPKNECEEDDLKHCAVVHRLDDVGRDDVDERFCHAHFGAGSCGVGHDDRGQVKTHTWRDQLGKADRDEHGESSGDDIHEQRADAHFSEQFRIRHRCSTAYDRTEDQWDHEHLHQANEPVTEHIEEPFGHILVER